MEDKARAFQWSKTVLNDKMGMLSLPTQRGVRAVEGGSVHRENSTKSNCYISISAGWHAHVITTLCFELWCGVIERFSMLIKRRAATNDFWSLYQHKIFRGLWFNYFPFPCGPTGVSKIAPSFLLAVGGWKLAQTSHSSWLSDVRLEGENKDDSVAVNL